LDAVEGGGRGGEHDDAIKAHGDAGGGGHMGEGRQEILVQRIAFAVDAGFFVHIRFEAGALFDGVGQFAKPICQLDTTGIKLKPLGDAGIIGGAAREGGFGGRVTVEHGGAAMTEVGFDLLDDEAGEDVGPGIIGGKAQALGLGGGAQGGGVACAILVDGGEEVDPGVACDGVADREAFEGGGGVAAGVAPTQGGRACGGGSAGEQSGAVVHQALIAFLCAIPFEHAEFIGMFGAVFAVAPDMGEGKDTGFACSEQLFHREFGGGVQIARATCAVIVADGGFKGVQVGFIAGADLHGVGVGFEKALGLEPVAEGFLDTVAGKERRAAVGVAGAIPPRGVCSLHQDTFDLAIFAPMGYRHRECAAHTP